MNTIYVEVKSKHVHSVDRNDHSLLRGYSMLGKFVNTGRRNLLWVVTQSQWLDVVAIRPSFLPWKAREPIFDGRRPYQSKGDHIDKKITNKRDNTDDTDSINKDKTKDTQKHRHASRERTTFMMYIQRVALAPHGAERRLRATTFGVTLCAVS